MFLRVFLVASVASSLVVTKVSDFSKNISEIFLKVSHFLEKVSDFLLTILRVFVNALRIIMVSLLGVLS